MRWFKKVHHYLPPDFILERNDDLCIRCKACVTQCSFDANFYDQKRDFIYTLQKNCVGCNRCVAYCPTEAIVVKNRPNPFREHPYWGSYYISGIKRRAYYGGAPVKSMGNDRPFPSYWDRLLLNASQVTNPSIDPLREPMELKTYIGKRPESLKKGENLPPSIMLETPIMIGAMSYGALSFNVVESIGRAVTRAGTFFNSGEGGLNRDHYKFSKHVIVQVASGRFGVHKEYLDIGSAIEIKIGQGAKPGIGGHLPGEKVSESISQTRMIPKGTDALSPAPHHDIYSIEDLRQLIYALKEATRYSKPVIVKIAAVHNVAAIASGIARSGADAICIDGFKGGTGAAPEVIRNHVGIPVELALAAVDTRLREEGIRNEVSIIASGGIRSSADVAKAIALGADAVYIGTAALITLGCTLCQQCHTGKCAWGITTQDPFLAKRVNPDIMSEHLYNLFNVWSLELKEIMGAMGVNSVESLRGNRLHLRGVGLSDRDLEILGVLPAGE